MNTHHDRIKNIISSGKITPEQIMLAAGGIITRNNVLTYADGLKQMPDYKIVAIQNAVNKILRRIANESVSTDA